MKMSCPHCGFTKEIDPGRIPPAATSATCPRCRQSFSLDAAGETPPPAAESPPQAPVPPPSPQNLPKAGFWIRVVAALLDSVAVTLLQFALAFLLTQAALLVAGTTSPMVEWTIQICGTLLAVAYYVFFTGYGGQTPGKMALKIKVVRTSGEEIRYGRAFLREVPGKFLSGILLGIGYLMVAFDREKQGLHDKIAKTYVIKI